MAYQEKISIYVPPHIKQQLEEDALQFDVFTKKDQSLNMNHFLSCLILGFNDTFSAEYTQTYTSIHTLLSNHITDTIECDEMTTKLLHQVIYPVSTRQGNSKSVAMSLKPTKDTEATIDDIRLDPRINDSLSRYFCRMFMSYCDKPSYEREQIIFAGNIDVITRACKTHSTLTFGSYFVKDKKFHVIPYKLVPNKEHIFNYLLCQDLETGKPCTFRLNRITNPRVSIDKTPISQETLDILKKMEKLGPQYAILGDEDIVVRLTPNGEKAYKMIYFGRPRYTHIERHEDYALYHFDCSQDQAFNYFRRFEKDNAIILSPETLKERIKDFHYNAYQAYK